MNKKNIKYKKTIIVFVLGISAISFVFITSLLFIYLSFKEEPKYNELKDVAGTNYEIYKDKVLVTIAGSGNFLVVGADYKSIKPIKKDDFNMRQLAKDDYSVFCGNKIIPKLNPENIQKAFKGYITDGNSAYYCDSSKKNENIGVIKTVLGFNKSSLDHDKPLVHFNELIKIDGVDANTLEEVYGGYAKDKNRVYYKGTVLEGADSSSITTVIDGLEENAWRKSFAHVKDDNHIFYKDKILTGANPNTTKVYEPDSGQIFYAYDSSSRNHYVEDKIFPKTIEGVDSSNLSIFLNNRTHAYHDMFINKNGIFYYEPKSKEFKLACKNTFGENLRKIEDGFWADERNSYFVEAYEHWVSSRKGIRLKYRATTKIIKVKDVSFDMWEKQPLHNNKKSLGTLYRVKDEYIFAARYGKGHFYNYKLYLIKDIDMFLSSENIDYSNLRKLLFIIEGDEICFAKTE